MAEAISENLNTNRYQADLDRILSSPHPLQSLKEVASLAPDLWPEGNSAQLKQQFLNPLTRQNTQAKMLWHCLPQIYRACARFQPYDFSEPEIVNLALDFYHQDLEAWDPKPDVPQTNLRRHVATTLEQHFKAHICDRFQLPAVTFPAVTCFYQAVSQFHQEMDSPPTPSDVAELKTIFNEIVQQEQATNQTPIPLRHKKEDVFDLILESYFPTAQDQIAHQADPADLEKDFIQKTQDQLLHHLLDHPQDSEITKREGLVTKLRYGLVDGEEKTLEQVGQIINRNRNTARQIEAKALRKLRHPKVSRKLR